MDLLLFDTLTPIY